MTALRAPRLDSSHRISGIREKAGRDDDAVRRHRDQAFVVKSVPRCLGPRPSHSSPQAFLSRYPPPSPPPHSSPTPATPDLKDMVDSTIHASSTALPANPPSAGEYEVISASFNRRSGQQARQAAASLTALPLSQKLHGHLSYPVFLLDRTSGLVLAVSSICICKYRHSSPFSSPAPPVICSLD